MNTALKILIVTMMAILVSMLTALIFYIVEYERGYMPCRTAGGVYVQGLCFKPEALFPR